MTKTRQPQSAKMLGLHVDSRLHSYYPPETKHHQPHCHHSHSVCAGLSTHVPVGGQVVLLQVRQVQAELQTFSR